MSNEHFGKITALPLRGSDLIEYVKVANEKFDDVLETIEATHPALIRKLWQPEDYIKKGLKPEMLPVDKNYALSLVESFLVPSVIELAVKVDEEGIAFN